MKKVYISFSSDIIPVSYTHLDVYKRQIRYDERLQGLARCRALVSATASPHHTLRYEEAAPVLADGVERVLIDLAVPRDISSRLGALPGLSLIHIFWLK